MLCLECCFRLECVKIDITNQRVTLLHTHKKKKKKSHFPDNFGFQSHLQMSIASSDCLKIKPRSCSKI